MICNKCGNEVSGYSMECPFCKEKRDMQMQEGITFLTEIYRKEKLMSRCSKKCNELKSKIDAISGLDDDFVFEMLSAIELVIDASINRIEHYLKIDGLNRNLF